MKKIIISICVLVTLFGCTAKENEIKIVTPTGAPALAFLEEMDSPNFETNSSPSNIISMMNSNSDKDIVVIDAISGIKAINNGAPYKLAALLTFGNFYIAKTGNDDDVMSKGDKIVLFGKGITPDIIFHYLFNDEFDDSIEYVNAVADAGKVLASGKNFETGNTIDYVFIAEPILTTILNNQEANTYGKAGVYLDIQEEYKKISGSSMIQAGLFVKDGSMVDEYLNNLENSINKLLNDETYVNSLLADKDEDIIATIYGLKTKQIKIALKKNSVSLGYKNAIDLKEDINNYLSLYNMETLDEEKIYK